MSNINDQNASFSKCGLYRWWLKRTINSNERKLLFIGLNPSIAGKEINDPTTTRLINFCRSWDYGTLLVINLFGLITTFSSSLKYASNPIGYKNDMEIRSRIAVWANDKNWDLWLGWGAKGTILNRNVRLIKTLKRFSQYRYQRLDQSKGPLVIGLTKGGHPMHPLYVASNKILNPFQIS